MSRSFKGRAVLPGVLEGEALVTRRGFNAFTSFYKSIVLESESARCSDQDNPDLYGKDLTGKVLCIPKTVGSTSQGAAWFTVARRGTAPRAMLFSESIDSLCAGALSVADAWLGRRICVVDQLGTEFLDCVEDGQTIGVLEDGTVMVKWVHGGHSGPRGGTTSCCVLVTKDIWPVRSKDRRTKREVGV